MTSRYLIDIQNRKSKIIHVYRNGDKYNRAALVLLRPIEQQQIERIFRAIEEKITLPYNKPIRKIYTLKGKEIDDPIFVKDQKYYVVGSSESFINTRYGSIYKWTIIGPVKWSKFSGVFYEPPEHDEMLLHQRALYQWKSNHMNNPGLPSKMTKSMSAYPSERKAKGTSKNANTISKRPLSEPSNDMKTVNKNINGDNEYLQSPDEKNSSGDGSVTSPKIITNQNQRSMDQFLTDSLKMYQLNDKISTDDIINKKEDDQQDRINGNSLKKNESMPEDNFESLANISEHEVPENELQVEGNNIVINEEHLGDKYEDEDSSNSNKKEENVEDEKENYLHSHLDILKPYASAENISFWKTNEPTKNDSCMEQKTNINCVESGEDDIEDVNTKDDRDEDKDEISGDVETDLRDSKEDLLIHSNLVKPHLSTENISFQDRHWRGNDIDNNTEKNQEINSDESDHEILDSQNEHNYMRKDLDLSSQDSDNINDVREMNVSHIKKDSLTDNDISNTEFEKKENEDQMDANDFNDNDLEISNASINKKEGISENSDIEYEAEQKETEETEEPEEPGDKAITNTSEDVLSEDQELSAKEKDSQMNLKDDTLQSDEENANCEEYGGVLNSFKLERDSEIYNTNDNLPVSRISEVSENEDESSDKNGPGNHIKGSVETEETHSEKYNSNSESKDCISLVDEDPKDHFLSESKNENQTDKEIGNEEVINNYENSKEKANDEVDPLVYDDSREIKSKTNLYDSDKEIEVDASDDELDSMIDTGKDEHKFKEKEIFGGYLNRKHSDIEDDEDDESKVNESYSLKDEENDSNNASVNSNLKLHEEKEDVYHNSDDEIYDKKEKEVEVQENDHEKDLEIAEEEDKHKKEEKSEEKDISEVEPDISYDNPISIPESEMENLEDQRSEKENKNEHNTNAVHDDSIGELDNSFNGIKPITDESDYQPKEQYNRVDMKPDDFTEKEDQEINQYVNDIIHSKKNEYEEENAAKIIQKNFRGHLVRKELTHVSKDIDNDESDGEQHRSYEVHDSEDDENDPDANLSYVKDATNDLITDEILDENSQIDNNYPDDIFSLSNKP